MLTYKSVGVRDAAFVQIEAASLLAGEERLDAETLPVGEAGILGRPHSKIQYIATCPVVVPVHNCYRGELRGERHARWKKR